MDQFETFEAVELTGTRHDYLQELVGLHSNFESSLPMVAGAFDSVNPSFSDNLGWFVGIENQAILQSIRPSIMESIETMLNGQLDINGNQTLGLNAISNWTINPEYYSQNLRQHAGYAAEVISTAKENIIAAAEKTGITTYRADDRPDLGFKKNDQYVDKIRVNSAGEIVERIQTKFFGDNGTEWVQKMMQKECDKYFDGHVDKIECPKNYYDEAKAYIPQWKEDLGRQLEHVTADGKDEAIQSHQARIDRLNKLDDMMEQSTVEMREAEYSVTHPKRFAAKLFSSEVFEASVKEGAYGAAAASGLTFVSSSVIHGTELMNGEITVDEMVREIATETGTAGAIGGTTAFVSAAIANSMQSSSCALIRDIGGSCLPVCAVAFAVESYDSVMDYAQGAIGAEELVYELGHNAATIGGGALGGAKVGAMAGTAFGPVGVFAGGLVGGLVGSAVASGAYETAVQYAPEAAEEIATQIKGFAQGTLDVIANECPERLENARAVLSEYFVVNEIPVTV